MVDTGLRRSGTAILRWDDVDIQTGMVRVRSGKGRKDRSVVVGIRTRRALLKRMRECDGSTDFGLTSSGLRQALRRVGVRAGFHITCLILRRTFATLALRAGINPLHLQALMGHTTLEMTRHYIQLARIDLLEAHNEHGPVDRLL